jgi:hypothetical protein
MRAEFRFICVLVFAAVLTAPVFAQGTVQGRVADVVSGNAPDGPVKVGVIALPQDSHPFNEITAATWQEAMDALADGQTPQTPFGSLAGNVPPVSTHFADAESDGTFTVTELPFETRLAVAARVGGLWWPLPDEFWLTEAEPATEVEIPVYALTDEQETVRIREWQLEAEVQMREDLHFAPVALVDTLRIENTSTTHGVLLELSLDVAVPPRLMAVHLPAMYGSELVVMHADNSREPHEQPGANALAAQSWRFGGADFMHGTRAVYNPGPQRSADNWHMLNQNNLAINGVGDTRFVIHPSPSGRSASVVFRRVVPPARDGRPGVLELRVRHRGGIEVENPEGRFQLSRSFPLDVGASSARVRESIHLSALVEPAHRRLYGETGVSGGMLAFRPHTEPLRAGEQAVVTVGLTTDAQARLREIAAGFMPERTAPPEQQQRQDGISYRTVFKALAVIFGLAFLTSLVATFRKPREKQLQSMARLPHTRAELLAALAQMQADYEQGRLPARSWLEQKQRLLNRLIELEVQGPDKDA